LHYFDCVSNHYATNLNEEPWRLFVWDYSMVNSCFGYWKITRVLDKIPDSLLEQ